MAKAEASGTEVPKEAAPAPATAAAATEAPKEATPAPEAAAAPAATATPAADSDKGAAPEGTGDSAPEGTGAPAEEPEPEISYDDPADVPAASFQSSRESIGKIHSVLDELLACKQRVAAGNSDAQAKFPEHAHQLQLHLLTLRRVHRSMVKASELARIAETASRRKVDAALAHAETRRHESGCLRTAAARCRKFPTPELDKLRPNLRDGAFVEGDDPAEESASPSAPSGNLSTRLEAELTERETLEAELKELQRVRSMEVDAINKLQAEKAEFLDLVRNGLRGLEPALNLIEPRKRPAQSVESGKLDSLPTPLRLVYAKFDNIATFSKESGVTVRVEALEQPPEKKARLEVTSDRPPAVCVKISSASNGAKAVGLRFTCPNGSILKVTPEAPSKDALLDCLWPEDDGLKTVVPEGVTELSGHPYYWAQVLGGLRETVSSSNASLATMDGVSAMDVVTKVRARMAA